MEEISEAEEEKAKTICLYLINIRIATHHACLHPEKPLLLYTCRSVVPLKFVLGIQAFDALQMDDDDKQQQRQWSSNDGGTAAAKGALGVTTISITCSIAVNLEKVCICKP